MLTFETENTKIQLKTDFFLTVTLMLVFCENETVIFSLISSLFHESGHLLSMYMMKIKPEKIVFSASGLKIERKVRDTVSFSKEITVALSGVSVNFFLFAAALGVYYLTGIDKALLFGLVNAVIGAFNLLPIESLDGANVLSFVLSRRLGEEKSEKIIIFFSIITCILISIFIIFSFCFKSGNPSLLICLLYLIIILINKVFELKKSVI